MNGENYSLNEILNLIISETGMSKEEIQALIQEKLKQFGEHITEQSAARLVATELGVSFPSRRTFVPFGPSIKINEITNHLQNIVITARVARIYDLFSFKRKDGSKGLLQPIILYDGTGEIRAVLWNQAAINFREKNCKIGDIIRLIGAYSRINDKGDLEVHANARTIIQVRPSNVNPDEFPKIPIRASKIRDIAPNTKDITLRGKVIKLEESVQYVRLDGSKGYRRRLILADDTGEVYVYFWNEKVKQLNTIKPGDFIEIIGLNSKLNNFGFVELHSTALTTLFRIKEGEDLEIKRGFVPSSSPLPIANKRLIKDIKKANEIISITALVISVKPQYTFSKKDETKGSVRNIVVSDKTGIIKVTLWGPHSEKVKEDAIFKIIDINNGYTKKDKYTDDIVIHCFSTTNISIRDIDKEEASEYICPFINIKEILSEQHPTTKSVNIRGTVVDIGEKQVITSKNNATMELKSFVISDHTEMIKVVCWGDNIRKISSLNRGDVIEIINARINKRERFGTELLITSDTTIISKPITNKRFSDFVPGTLVDMINEKRDILAIEETKDGSAVIQGTIIEIISVSSGTGCPHCKIKIEKKDKEYYCVVHKSIEKPLNTTFLQFLINDGTGTLTVVASKESLQEIIKIDTSSESQFGILELNKQILHKEVEIKGVIITTKHSELFAEKVRKIDYNDSIRELTKYPLK